MALYIFFALCALSFCIIARAQNNNNYQYGADDNTALYDNAGLYENSQLGFAHRPHHHHHHRGGHHGRPSLKAGKLLKFVIFFKSTVHKININKNPN